MADYILLANPSLPVQPEVFAQKPNRATSLDSLLEECPSAENTLSPIAKNIYYKGKRKVSRLLHKNLPNMSQLWVAIDNLENNLGDNPNFRAKRLAIALRREQYAILEFCLPQKPPLPQPRAHKEYLPWADGVELENGDIALLDLSNTTHMAHFLLLLPELLEYCTSPYSDLYTMLEEVGRALTQASLSPSQRLVLTLYYSGHSGKEIADECNSRFGVHYNQAYISTILHAQIPRKVARIYTNIRDERLYSKVPSKWRVCPHCGRKLLLSPYNFYRRKNRPDGYSILCKACTNGQQGGQQGKHLGGQPHV